MATKEENLIQLVLTQDEALILCSITSLGLKTLKGDDTEVKMTLELLGMVMGMCSAATLSLSEKMVALTSVTVKYAKERMERKQNEVKVVDNGTEEI